MITDPYVILHDLSESSVLELGDLIDTGRATGDVVEMRIDEHSSQRQAVVVTR